MADDLKFRVVGDTRQAQAEFGNFQRFAQSSFREMKQEAESSFRAVGEAGRGSSKILREAYTTLASELIESYGVDGDIANEMAKMFAKLPPQAQVALAAVAAAFVAAAGAAVGLVLVTKQMIDVAGQVGTKSKEDFEKFEKAIKDAGGEITRTDRALSQELMRSLDLVKSAVDNLFIKLLRESGPALIVLLRQVKTEVDLIAESAPGMGRVMSYSFSIATAGLATLNQTLYLTGQALAGLLTDDKVKQAKAIAAAIKAIDVAGRFDQNLKDAISAASSLTLKPPTLDTKDKKERDGESSIDKLIFKERTEALHTESLRDIEVLRAATDAYLAQFDAKINLRKGFIAILEGQQKAFNEAVKSGAAAAKDLRDTHFETAEEQLRRLATFAGTEALIVQGRAELQRQAEKDRTESRRREIQAALEANALEVGDDAKTKERKLENQRLYHQLLEEEKLRHKAAIEAIDRDEQVGVEQATPGSFRNRFGGQSADALGQTGEKLEGFAALVAGFKARVSGEFKALAQTSQTPLQNLGGTISQMGISLAQSGFAALVAGKNISQALRQAAAAGIAAIAQLAAVEAIKNVGYALNAMGYTIFTADPRGAAAASHYWAAAAAWGSIALGAAVGAAALSGGGAGAGNGALGNQLTGTRQDENTVSTERRYDFVERDAAGRRSEVTSIRVYLEEGLMAKKIDNHLEQDYRSHGRFRQMLDDHSGGLGLTTG